MKNDELIWSNHPKNKASQTKHILSQLSLKVRGHQLEIFMREFKPTSGTKVLDVGVSPYEELIDTNYFEKHYAFPKQLTGVGVEDCSAIKAKYPLMTVIHSPAGAALPFSDGHFDIATSWATLEHVGDYEKQMFFLRECLRVGKQAFLTVPYRGCIYEPHAGVFFLHWLPLTAFRWICKKAGKAFWSEVANLNPLYIRDIKRMIGTENIEIRLYRMFGFLDSHLLIIKK